MITEFRGEYFFLSNFYPIEIEFEGLTYPSVEHAYQASKCANYERRELFLTGTAANARQMGKSFKRREDWESVKVPTMRLLVYKKFEDPILAGKLLATNSQELIHGNSHGDQFWGMSAGSGRNELGKILMEIRELVRDKVSSSSSTQH